MSRFDYVAYDMKAQREQETAKDVVRSVERIINKIGHEQPLVSEETSRAKTLALSKLEECYMWIGKAIRDDQIARNGSAPLLEERKNG